LSEWVYLTANLKRPEWIFGMILLLIRSPGGEAPDIPDFSPQVEDWPLRLEGELRDIVLDVHTGKRKRSDPEALLDFAVRGAHVENEAVLHPCHVALKEFYVECKKPGTQWGVYPLVPATTAAAFNYKDADVFVPTGELIGFKTPTFFATMIESEASVFVKLVKAGDAEFAIRCHEYREKLGLFTVPTTVLYNVKMTHDYASMAPEKRRCAWRHSQNQDRGLTSCYSQVRL
jgi:hypothetical protein